VDDVFIAGTALVGLVAGAALDPLGQRLAEASRAHDERRRAERARRALDEERLRLGGQIPAAAPPEEMPSTAGAPLGGAPVPSGAMEVPELPVESPASATDAEPGDPTGAEGVRHLLPAGRSPTRTMGAALVTGLLFAGAAYHFGPHLIAAPYCVLFAMLVTVSVTDLSHRLVPRWIIYAGLAGVVPLLVVTSAADHSWEHLSGSAIAGAVAFGVFFVVWWFVPRGMGFGDVRLAGAIGIAVGYLSLLHAYIAFLAGFVAGLVFGLAVMATSASGRRTRIPFAPSLALGAVVSVFWGAHVAQAFFPVGS
jgi:leader peptidase (prepilin peptidase)/N-methyltransferase